MATRPESHANHASQLAAALAGVANLDRYSRRVGTCRLKAPLGRQSGGVENRICAPSGSENFVGSEKQGGAFAFKALPVSVDR